MDFSTLARSNYKRMFLIVHIIVRMQTRLLLFIRKKKKKRAQQSIEKTIKTFKVQVANRQTFFRSFSEFPNNIIIVLLQQAHAHSRESLALEP